MIYEFTRRFSMGHRLIGVPKCANLHGHNFELKWSLTFSHAGANSAAITFDRKSGMIEPFSVMKTKFHYWIDNHVDHSLALAADDPLLEYLFNKEPEHNILVTPMPPTTEVLAMLFYLKINAFQQKAFFSDVEIDITLIETPTNSVKLTNDYKRYARGRMQGGWANRSDMSINDLSLLQADKMTLVDN